MLANGTSLRRPFGRGGFALVDVLVAGVLLSITLVAVLTISTQSISDQIHGQQLMRASSMIDEILHEVFAVGAERYQSDFETDGERDGYEGFTYQVEFGEAADDEPTPVSVTVWWSESGKPFSEKVSTLISFRWNEDPDATRVPEVQIEREGDL